MEKGALGRIITKTKMTTKKGTKTKQAKQDKQRPKMVCFSSCPRNKCLELKCVCPVDSVSSKKHESQVLSLQLRYLSPTVALF